MRFDADHFAPSFNPPNDDPTSDMFECAWTGVFMDGEHDMIRIDDATISVSCLGDIESCEANGFTAADLERLNALFCAGYRQFSRYETEGNGTQVHPVVNERALHAYPVQVNPS